ncbi:unnamed protein product [Withania somnifera]
MHHFTRKKLLSSAERLKKEHDYYLKNGSAVLEELLSLCNGNCRTPIRYFSNIEIENATDHSAKKIELADARASMVTGSLDNRLFLIRFSNHSYGVHRDIAVTAQMSHLKNVLRLVGCCLEFEKPVMVYEYVDAVTLDELLFNKARKSLLSWRNRLRIANEVASAIVFLHTEFTTPIINRCICPSNVIIDQTSSVAKLMDFSLSLSLPRGKCEIRDLPAGRIGYVDPEYFRTCKVTQKIDVFSFGVVLFQLLTRKKVSIVDGKMIRCGESPDYVDSYIGECNVMDIVDSDILEELGIEIQQQLEDYLNLVKKCTTYKGENRPYMIHAARELRRIEKCFRTLTLADEN